VPAENVPIRVEVNGQAHELEVRPDERLVTVLRERLGLTGVKETCSVGVCGVCSVIIDGRLVSGCLVPAVRVDRTRVTTIEGIATGGDLTPVQRSFIHHGGLQCGICTPGQVVAATALLAEDPTPEVADVVDWMKGNLCRCTGYFGIVASILAAAGQDPSERFRPPVTEA
jgi:carbon-monoxide dehydrogenase small subunit